MLIISTIYVLVLIDAYFGLADICFGFNRFIYFGFIRRLGIMQPDAMEVSFQITGCGLSHAKVCIFIKTRACRKGFFAITYTKTRIIMIQRDIIDVLSSHRHCYAEAQWPVCRQHPSIRRRDWCGLCEAPAVLYFRLSHQENRISPSV